MRLYYLMENYVRARVSLVIRDIEKIFSAAEVIFLMFLVEYYATEAPR